MNESIRIENFGPISFLNVQIKRLTVFIGEQGSGKSTISKVLTICRDIMWQYLVLTGKDAMNAFVEMDIDKYFHDNTIFEYEMDGLKVTYRDGEFKCWKEGVNSETLILRHEKRLAEAGRQIMLNLGYAEIEELKKNSADMQLFISNSKTLLYIPAERIMAGQLSESIKSILAAEIPIGKPIREYMSIFEKARKSFGTFDVSFLDVKYKYSDGKEGIIVGENGDTTELPLSACSSGMQSVLPLIMVLEYCTKNDFFDSFVVEEPEQNLFPTNQLELMRFLLGKWNDESNNYINMVITTHSPYILSVLNNSLYAKELALDTKVDSEKVNNIISASHQVSLNECAVYSLEKTINGDEYCKPVISSDSGLIDYNYLDAVSIQTSNEFDKLQDIFLNIDEN